MEQKRSLNLKDLKARVEEIHALELRAQELKNAIVKDSASSMDEAIDDLNFLLLQSEERFMAIPLMYVDEVLDMPQLEPLPEPRPPVVGLINYHGEYLTVIDVRPWVGQPGTPLHPDQTIVICSVPPKKFALKVDEALEVITATEKDISVASRVLPGVLGNSGMIRISDKHNAIILNISRIALNATLVNPPETTTTDSETTTS